MSTFEPGPGWREVSSVAYANHRHEKLRIDVSNEDNGLSRYWIWEEPVAAIPTNLYTVIRVAGRPAHDGSLFVLVAPDEWCNAVDAVFLTAKDLQECITGFEVLAVPNAAYDCIGKMEQVKHETAKAVLNRLREVIPHSGVDQMEPWLQAIEEEFGVNYSLFRQR